MIRFFQYLLLLSFFTFKLQAQSISISSVTSKADYLCVGQRAFIKYSLTGEFASNNKFTVQVKNSYDGDNTWKNVSTRDSSGTLIFTLPESLIKYTYGNAGYFNTDFRVVASSPQITSNSLQYKSVFALPVVEFTSIKKKVLYPYEAVQIGLKLSGSTPMDVFTSDSSKIYITNFDSNSNQNLFNVNPYKSGVYSIIGASNMCGVGTVKGEQNITVIDKRIQVTGLSNLNICRKSKLDVYYAATGNWDANTKFSIRLLDKNYFGSTSFYDLEATNNNGVLSTVISETIPLGNYEVKIVTAENPVIESSIYQNFISIRNEPKVELTSESTTISYGQTATLNYSITGYGPFSIELSNGQVFNETVDDGYNRGLQLSVSPTTTTLYSIKSFTSSICGVGKGNNSVLVTVQPGIKTDSLKAGKYCLGSTCEVKFSSNQSLRVGSNVMIRLTNDKFNLVEGYIHKDIVGTVIRENVASFTLPMTLLNDFGYVTFFAGVYTAETPNIIFSPNMITVQAAPSASIINTSTIKLETPQELPINLVLRGGDTYEVVLSDNRKYKIDHTYFSFEMSSSISVYFAKTGSIAVASVSNACGTSNYSSPISKQVNVGKVDYSLELTSESPQPLEVCAGKKVNINLSAMGNFGQDNQFTLILTSDNYYISERTIGTIKAGIAEVLIPSDLTQGIYYLKVSSTNPIFYSNKIQIAVRTSPTISITDYASSELLVGQIPNIYAGVSGGGQVDVLYKDGTKVVYELGNYTNSFYLGRPLSQTTVFGVQSVSNACGVGKVSTEDVVVKVKPYKIVSKFYSYDNNPSGAYCSNFKIPINFYTVGKVGSDVTFYVQMAKSGQNNFTTILSDVKQSPALLTIPESEKNFSYKIRIVSSDTLIQSNVIDLNLNYLPELTLKLSDGKSETTIEAGQSVSLTGQLKFTDYSGVRYLIVDDKNNTTTGLLTYSPYLEVVKTVTENTVFTLASISNECGVGKASGTVKVTTRPVVNLSLLNAGSNIYCIGGNIQAKLSAVGAFEKNNIFEIFATDDNGLTTKLLTTSKSGNVLIPLSNQLKRGGYKIKIESTNPYQTKEIAYIVLTEPLDVSIVGNPIINQGESAYIFFKNNKGLTNGDRNNYNVQDYVSYELSDGSSGNIYLSTNWPSSLLVSPTSTTTYTLKSIQNTCGAGKMSGNATVTVNPNVSKQVALSYISFYSTSLCRGSVQNIYFVTKGTFSEQNKFKVQISDSTGKNYKDLVTEGNTSPLKVTIPLDLPLGFGYYFRVVASDADAVATSSNVAFTILEAITGRFESESYYFNENKPVTINLTFTGTPPFTFYIGADELSAKMYSTNTNNFGITLNPVANTAYRLFSISNGTCGTGTILSPSTVKIELVTALEELGKLGINVFPNPTADVIQIEAKDKELSIQLIDFSGKIVQEQVLRGEQKQVDISKVSSGTYFLRVLKEAKEATFKIIKL